MTVFHFFSSVGKNRKIVKIVETQGWIALNFVLWKWLSFHFYVYLEVSSEGEEPRALGYFYLFSHIPKEEKKKEAVVYVCAGSFWVPLMFGNTLRLTS